MGSYQNSPSDVPWLSDNQGSARGNLKINLIGDGRVVPVQRVMEEFQAFDLTHKDIYHDLNGYSLKFTLPDGKSVKLSHKDRSMLLKAAQALYQGKLKEKALAVKE